MRSRLTRSGLAGWELAALLSGAGFAVLSIVAKAVGA